MTAPAYLPFYPADYLSDTHHLSLEEHGAYLKLLMIAWRTDDCALPDDDRRIATMLGVTGKKWASLKPAVMAFWKLADGRWTQARLSETRRAVAKKSEDNRQSANARWSRKRLKDNAANDANAHADAMPLKAQSSKDITPTGENEPNVVPGKPGYAFEGSVIRLTRRDFDKWRLAYPNVDLRAALTSRDDWLASEAAEKDRAKWFVSTSAWLAKVNTQQRQAIRADEMAVPC